jgi:hypothetical protein
MFEILNQVRKGDAIHAAYEATLQLYQHDRLKTLRDRGFPLTDDELAAQLLDEIGVVEGKHVADLPKEKISSYIVKIVDVLMDRIRKETPLSGARGEEILAEMRVQYAWPHYGRPERGAPVRTERRAVG